MSNEPIRRKGVTLGVQRRLSVEDQINGQSQVIEENFPKQRTLHLVPDNNEPPAGERVKIVVTKEVLFETANHVGQDLSNESGGFLLGNRYECLITKQEYIVIDQFMKADYTEGTQVSLTFTTDSWAQLKDRLDGKYRGKELLGWYHSHPGMGIFLSTYDLDIHNNRFSKEWEVALVLDPVNHEGGFFGWSDGNVHPREMLDFYELLEGESRETVVAWKNYDAEDPKTGLPVDLNVFNTKNPTGETTGDSVISPKPGGFSINSLLTNPYAVIGGAGLALLLLLTSLLIVYFYVFPRPTSTEVTSANDAENSNNKVLKGRQIQVSKDMAGRVTDDNSMIVSLKINGIGESQVIEEIIKNKDLKVEINSAPAKIIEAKSSNGAILTAVVERTLSDQEVDEFRDNKTQDFRMIIDLYYNGDSVTKTVDTKFKKGSGGDTQGEEIVFNNFNQTTAPSRAKTDAPDPKTPRQPAEVAVEDPKPAPAPRKIPQQSNPKASTDDNPSESDSKGLRLGIGDPKENKQNRNEKVNLELNLPNKIPNRNDGGKTPDPKKDGKQKQKGVENN